MVEYLRLCVFAVDLPFISLKRSPQPNNSANHDLLFTFHFLLGELQKMASEWDNLQ